MLIPVILSGGVGSRLWPLSRKACPKPFIHLDSGHSLLQETILRASRLPDVNQVITVSNPQLLFQTRDQYWNLEPPVWQDLALHFILEPFGRGTAPAAALAALWSAQQHGPDTLLLILPADHRIDKEATFAEAVDQAAALARDGAIVCFGITPKRPESGYGYIEHEGNRVLHFAEKPPVQQARAYMENKSALWNAGMFCVTAGSLIKELTAHCPEVLDAARNGLQQASESRNERDTVSEIEARAFDAMPAESIDQGIMERTDNAAVVACDIGWDDIGSWSALCATLPMDEHGNRSRGQVLQRASSNCILLSENRVLAALGLNDLLVVDTPDALLVARRDQEQEIRHLYQALEAQGCEAHEYHQTVERHWGCYTVLDSGTGYKVKRLEVRPGGQLSLQSHERRNEHWTVVSGVATVTRGKEQFTLQTNESTYIERRTKHRLENHQREPLLVIETQTGDYLGEDDIVRY